MFRVLNVGRTWVLLTSVDVSPLRPLRVAHIKEPMFGDSFQHNILVCLSIFSTWLYSTGLIARKIVPVLLAQRDFLVMEHWKAGLICHMSRLTVLTIRLEYISVKFFSCRMLPAHLLTSITRQRRYMLFGSRCAVLRKSTPRKQNRAQLFRTIMWKVSACISNAETSATCVAAQ